MNNKKGMSLIELSIGAVIGLILITAAMLILVWITKMQGYFHIRTSDDMSWMSATEHMKRRIHGASYVEIPNQAMLRLRDYNGNQIGTYTNTANGLNFDTDNVTFENVAATFDRIYPPAPGPRITEVRVNYTAPVQIASSIVIKCGVDSSSTWAETTAYGAWQIQTQESMKGTKIRQAKSGGYIMVANSRPNNGSYSYAYVIKVDNAGKYVWSRTLSCGNGTYTLGIDVWETTAGGEFVVLCGTSSTMRLVRLNDSGAFVSNTNVGSAYPSSMSPTSDGGYIVAGLTQVTTSPYQQYCLVVKVNSSLGVQWSKQVKNKFCPSPSTDQMHIQIWPTEIIEAFSSRGGPSTGYVLVGTLISPAKNCSYTNPYGIPSNTDVGSQRVGFLFKFDSAGNESWYKTYFTSGSSSAAYWSNILWGPREYGASVMQTFDITGAANGYLMGGSSGEAPGVDELSDFASIRKTDVNGDMIWIRTIRNTRSIVTSIAQVTPISYVIASTSQNSSDGYYFIYEGTLQKLDANFSPTTTKTFSGGSRYYGTHWGNVFMATRYSAIPTSDGGYALFGSEINSAVADGLTGWNERLYIIKTDADGKCPEITSPQRIAEVPPMSSI